MPFRHGASNSWYASMNACLAHPPVASAQPFTHYSVTCMHHVRGTKRRPKGGGGMGHRSPQ
jgi:hypothetical protein